MKKIRPGAWLAECDFRSTSRPRLLKIQNTKLKQLVFEAPTGMREAHAPCGGFADPNSP